MCSDCEASRETRGLWRRFDPLCLWCGARLIQTIKGLHEVSRDRRAERMRVVLQDWVSYGHSEAELRALSSSASVPWAPPGSQDPPTPTKHR